MACETRRGPLQLQVRNVEKLMRQLSILVHSGSTIYSYPLTAGQLQDIVFDSLTKLLFVTTGTSNRRGTSSASY